MLTGSLLCWVRKDEGMIKPVLGFVGFFIFTYLGVAFMGLEMNPADWTVMGRTFLFVVGSWGGVLTAIVIKEREKRNE
jgi:hypothetical protein